MLMVDTRHYLLDTISGRKRYLPKYENIQCNLMVDDFQIGTLNKMTN